MRKFVAKQDAAFVCRSVLEASLMLQFESLPV